MVTFYGYITNYVRIESIDKIKEIFKWLTILPFHIGVSSFSVLYIVKTKIKKKNKISTNIIRITNAYNLQGKARCD